MQVGGFRESHDYRVGARTEDSGVTIIRRGNVINSGYETLRVCGLGSPTPAFILALAECFIGFVCKERSGLCPEQISDGGNHIFVRYKRFPQFSYLDIPGLALVNITLEVAAVSKLLGPVSA